MGCLFGYAGRPDPAILEKMGNILKHRCAGGWEKVAQPLGRDQIMEIGHGVAPWARGPQVFQETGPAGIFGYAGVLFSKNGRPVRNMADAPETKLENLNGFFTGALGTPDAAYLIRDPAGCKVLYWTRHKERLVFASEIKALFADPLVQRKLRIGALPEYFTFSFVPGQGTMFENIFELQPGTLLTWKDGRTALRRHFTFENFEPDPPSGNGLKPADYARQVRADLEASVAEACGVQEAPPAVFLSGGIDSSAVLAVTARRFPDTPVKTFSVHFGPKYANENEYISMMSKHCRTDHTWLEVRPSRFLKQMRDIIWMLDDPIGDPITVPNFLLAQAASKVSRVSLNGEGGDPCFGGPKNIPMLLSGLYGPFPGQAGNGWAARNYLMSYRKCYEDLDEILSPEVMAASGGREALTGVIDPFLKAAPPRSFVNKLMSINIRLKGANLILVKVDKMTSANGLLALPPLFSRRIIETSMACPPRLKLMGNIEKGVLKQAVADIVPRPIIDRPKSGMMVPVRFWFRGEMRRYAKRMLSKKRLARIGLFNPDYVKRLLDYDAAEIYGARHGLKLWMLVTFMSWHDRMIEAAPWTP